MPDLLNIFGKRWKLMLLLTALATLIAFFAALFSPKKYLSVATALPANPVMADKARLFNNNIEALYSDFGSPDELDKLEGTATLDTIFIAAAQQLNLVRHYSISSSNESLFKAAKYLKKNSNISRSGYGELKVKVWDKDRNTSAVIANFLLQKIQELHQHLLNQSNISALEILKKEYEGRQKQFLQLADSSAMTMSAGEKEILRTKMNAVAGQLTDYENRIDQYQLAIKTNAPVLLVVENARAPLSADKPRIGQTTGFVFFGALVFSFLLALFIEGRKHLT